MRAEIDLYRTAFDAGLYQPDGFQTEMACRTNQFGSIVSTSRETLDEGKVILTAAIRMEDQGCTDIA